MAKKAKSSASPAKASDGIPNPTAGDGTPKKPPLTDAERHKRFVSMAKEVGASKDAKDFDAAFSAVTAKSPSG